MEMAKRGAKVYLACRDMQKCEEAKQEIITTANNPNVHARKLDLGSMESVRNFVVKCVAPFWVWSHITVYFISRFLEEEDHLDILINNAGLNTKTRVLTEDGFENTFAVNHLGHFLLTNLLLDTLKVSNSEQWDRRLHLFFQKSAPSRIVVVSSAAHMLGKIKKDNLMLERAFKQFKAYANSKLANILFTIHLEKLLSGSGVTVNALHPGVVQTDIWRYMHWSLRWGDWPMKRKYEQNIFKVFSISHRYLLSPIYVFFLKTAESGAQTQIKLALDPDLKNVSGKYFVDCAETKPSKHALDLETAKWLWNKSAQLTGLERK
jgi:NAD(P)-dependent dehydrogenase (short-subunit alcohol dehydrogenase family)